MTSRTTGAMVYLDNAATTAIDPAVANAMAQCLATPGGCANPSSNHAAGRQSAAIVGTARRQVATLLNTDPERIVFTSGATESNNLALFGAARFRARRGRHLVTMTTEHKSVTECFEALEREGFDVTWLDPRESGLLDLDELRAALRDDTQMVSIMHVNNETGVIQDIDAIGSICRERKILYHCDAAQSVGKMPLDLSRLPIDLLSLTAHKFHGPQGIGALYMTDRPGCQLSPLIFGGSQERRIRPGSHAVHQIAGIGKVAELAVERLGAGLCKLHELRERLWRGIEDVPDIRRNGSAGDTFPGILSVSAAGVDGESLLLALEPLCVATGSACNSQTGESSYVLRAMGLDDRLAQGAIRFSFGAETSESDIDTAIERYRFAVAHLRTLAPPALSGALL